MNQKKKSKTIRYIVAFLSISVLASFGIYYYIQSSKYESTDNAQLDGDIVSIRASVTAYIDKINFVDNQQVSKGDTLIQFNTIALRARVTEARAALANALSAIKVNTNRATASAKNAAASLQLAQSNQLAINIAKAQYLQAEADYSRMQKLFAIKGATEQQLEASRTKRDVSKVQYDEAISKKRTSFTSANGQNAVALSDKAQITSAEALVEQRKAELLMAEDDLKHAYVVAPQNGTVTKRAVQAGQFVSTGSNLCSIVDNQHLWVTANIKETQLSQIKIGQKVKISIDAYPDIVLTGKVASYSGATGAKFSLIPPDNASGNFVKVVQRFPIRISIDENAENINKKTELFPGLSAAVKIRTQ